MIVDDLKISDIGTRRVRLTFEHSTAEGLLTRLDPDVTLNIIRSYSGELVNTHRTGTVLIGLDSGRIEIQAHLTTPIEILKR